MVYPQAPCDNGSKIQNYILQWDEVFFYHVAIVYVQLRFCVACSSNSRFCFLKGKGTGIYEQCYYGPQKQYRVTKLSPASKYSFRLSAKNDMGVR